MAVNISFAAQKGFPLKAADILDGRAYITQDDPKTVFIGNRIGGRNDNVIVAFSVCGKMIIFLDNDCDRFQEVDISITVE